MHHDRTWTLASEVTATILDDSLSDVDFFQGGPSTAAKSTNNGGIARFPNAGPVSRTFAVRLDAGDHLLTKVLVLQKGPIRCLQAYQH